MHKGISTQLDADRALAAVELRRAALLRTQSQIKSVSDQLKLLLNLPEGVPEIFPITKPVTTSAKVDVDEALSTSLKNRPELTRAQKVIDVSKTRVD